MALLSKMLPSPSLSWYELSVDDLDTCSPAEIAMMHNLSVLCGDVWMYDVELREHFEKCLLPLPNAMLINPCKVPSNLPAFINYLNHLRSCGINIATFAQIESPVELYRFL